MKKILSRSSIRNKNLRNRSDLSLLQKTAIQRFHEQSSEENRKWLKMLTPAEKIIVRDLMRTGREDFWDSHIELIPNQVKTSIIQEDKWNKLHINISISYTSNEMLMLFYNDVVRRLNQSDYNNVIMEEYKELLESIKNSLKKQRAKFIISEGQ